MNTQDEDEQLVRNSAIIALLAQSLVLLVAGIQSCYYLFNLGPIDIDISSGLLVLVITFCIPTGLLTLGLAYGIYSGNERLKILRYWAGLCICYGLFFVLMIFRILIDAPSLLSIWFPTFQIILSLVPAYGILRFTGLYDEKREYHH